MQYICLKSILHIYVLYVCNVEQLNQSAVQQFMVNMVNLFKKAKEKLLKNWKKGITIFQKSNSNIPEKKKFLQKRGVGTNETKNVLKYGNKKYKKTYK